jgi:hypothetical protein
MDKSHEVFNDTAAVIGQLRNIQEYKVATICAVIADESTKDIIKAMQQDGKDIYKIPCGMRYVYSPTGGKYRYSQIWHLNLPKADILVSGCKWYNSNRAVFTPYSRTKDFCSFLKYRNFIPDSTVKIAVASSFQLSSKYKDSKRLFYADWILTPEAAPLLSQRVPSTCQRHVPVPVGVPAGIPAAVPVHLPVAATTTI